MDEIALKRAVVKADKVQKVIDAHEEVWDEIKSDIARMLFATKSDDKEKREDMYRAHQGILMVQALLQRSVSAGKKAEEELRQNRDGN